jgi:hypothetical protein
MKYKTLYILIVSVLSLGILNSCTERIDIELEQEYTRLAVEGYITPGGKAFQYVRLTTTAGYFSNDAPPQVSGATVTVEEGDNVFLFDEDMNNPGYYLPPDGFHGESEKTYQLIIDLDKDIAGEKHFEAQETMPVLSDDIDSIRIIYRSDFEFWVVKFYGYDPPGPNYYMFNAFVNGVFITDTISKVGLTDDKLVDDSYINGAYVMVLERSQLNPGDHFTLITSSVTEDYFNYITELQTEISPKIPLFSGPPANVSTNLNKGAVGYFAAFPSVFTDYIVRPL